MVIGKRDALVALEQLRRLFGIVLGAPPHAFIVILVGGQIY